MELAAGRADRGALSGVWEGPSRRKCGLQGLGGVDDVEGRTGGDERVREGHEDTQPRDTRDSRSRRRRGRREGGDLGTETRFPPGRDAESRDTVTRG